MNKKPLISIILRSYNEEKWIGHCLQAIYAQEFQNFEVILVDNNSTDRTLEKAKQFPITILNIDKFRPGESLNIGIRASRGEFIVCLSAHCLPVNNKWLGNLLRNFEDSEVAGVYGRQEPMSFTPDTDKRDLMTIFGLDKKVQYKDSFFHNANSMLRRDLWERIPFDEEITNIEDRLWAREILQLGYKIIYEPEASVYHHHGIHQNQNKERCSNVVRILENLDRKEGKSFQGLNLERLKITALIPVRGEMLTLNGRPLLEYTIKQAKQSRYIQDVIVLTDSKEHAEVAKACGAQVPFLRDASFSADFVDIEHVYQYGLEELEKRGHYCDLIVTLGITFPFRPQGFLDRLIERLAHEGLDSIISVRPEFSSCWIKEEKTQAIKRMDAGFIPRAYKEPTYLGIEGLGIVTHPLFLREAKLLGNKVGIMEVTNPYSPVEIRDAMGLKFAENLLPHWESELQKS